jgi:hypothetical protein
MNVCSLTIFYVRAVGADASAIPKSNFPVMNGLEIAGGP